MSEKPKKKNGEKAPGEIEGALPIVEKIDPFKAFNVAEKIIKSMSLGDVNQFLIGGERD